MAKILIIFRHAKSSWSSGSLSDHERPLNERGMQEAPITAEKLAEQGFEPDTVLCSDAKRAQETWNFARSAFTSQPNISFLSELYNGSRDDICALVGQQADKVATLLLLGHNPMSEELIDYLSNNFTELKTSNAAVLRSDAKSWNEAVCKRGKWTLVTIIRPKD